MHQWCSFEQFPVIPESEFIRHDIITNTGQPFHLETELVDHLAEMVMQRYEVGFCSFPVTLPEPGTIHPLRTLHHYKRLLYESNGAITFSQDFVTHASETLGLWLEWETDNVLYAQGGEPGNADPVWDVISIVRDEQNSPHLQIVQVKATKANVQQQASIALTKFALLEAGHYDSELSCRLELMRRVSNSSEINAADLVFDSDRRYRVTIVHGLPEIHFKFLSTFPDKIPGALHKRSAYLIRTEFESLWNTLGRRIYDQLF